ncbi:hypothetical protein Bca52824_065357 [Brassica carinata]|uniref:Uncharacterized protein n=1 Tax=Brassica carinata TaxID=52824 RepID=A0A8X7QIK5_BRACI|nr:hypothetical protein Bca52824_065357 [Brassica carinata]
MGCKPEVPSKNMNSWSLKIVLVTRRLREDPEVASGTRGSHWQILEGAGVGVMTQVPGFAAFHDATVDVPFLQGLARIEVSQDLIQLRCPFRCVPPGFLCWRSSSEAYNGSSSMIPMRDLFGNVGRLQVSVVYDKYQNAKAWKRRLSYTPPPRLARAAFSANGLSSTSSTSAEVMPNRDPLVYAHRRLIGEVFLLRSQVQDMMARRDLLVQQVKASARWELMKEWLESVWALESGRRVSASSVPIWRDQLSVRELLPGCNPEIRCWPLSSSYAVFYLRGSHWQILEGAGVGVMTQVPSLAAFRLEKQDFDCSYISQ